MTDTSNPGIKTRLESLFHHGLAAADAQRAIGLNLPDPPANGRVIVVGAGKASALMAQHFEQIWQDKHPQIPLSGLVITRMGQHIPTRFIKIIEAAHPIPNEAGLQATSDIIRMAEGIGPHDLMVALISGGGSSLMTAPLDHVSLRAKRDVTRQLLQSGASIGEINCVRRHLSKVKGGRLAKMAEPARVHSLIISDVVGDTLSDIASGPTAPDPTTRHQALKIIEDYRIRSFQTILQALHQPSSETIKPDDPIWLRNDSRLVSTPAALLEGVKNRAKDLGYSVINFGTGIEGEAHVVGGVMAALAWQWATTHAKHQKIALISGGETTVTVHGNGRGGRNTEFLLGLALKVRDLPFPSDVKVSAMAADTDGIDGSEHNAGAFFLPDSWERWRHKGIDVNAHLANNDAYTAFDAIGGVFFSGPTHNNVNDLRIVLLDPLPHKKI